MNRDCAPVHPQLMDPAEDPQELIESSIFWYPLLFPTRTEVLEHLMLCGGNGYEWGADGNMRSVFSHIAPDYDRLNGYEMQAREYETEASRETDLVMRALLLEQAERERGELARLLAIRADYLHLARTYDPVRTAYYPGEGEGMRMISTIQLSCSLLGRAPDGVRPVWRRVLEETRKLFAEILIEQGTLF